MKTLTIRVFYKGKFYYRKSLDDVRYDFTPYEIMQPDTHICIVHNGEVVGELWKQAIITEGAINLHGAEVDYGPGRD